MTATQCKLNTLPKLLLILLKTESLTGYNLTKRITSSAAWKASHQQIYRELTKMGNEGLVTFKIVPQEGKPDRKLYTITQTGNAKLAASLQVKPEQGKYYNEATVMMLAGNPDYFEQLAAIHLLEIEQLTEKLDGDLDLAEEMVISREISLRQCEHSWCLEAVEMMRHAVDSHIPEQEAA